MAGPIEELILTGLHEKAMEVEMDLNDPIEFKKFAAKMDEVVAQVTNITRQVIENTRCGCGKKPPPSSEVVTRSTAPDVEVVVEAETAPKEG